MNRISKNSGNKAAVFSWNFMEIWKYKYNKIVVEGALEGCNVFPSPFSRTSWCCLYSVCTWNVSVCPSVCSSVTLWSVSASDSTEKLKCAQVFMTHGLYWSLLLFPLLKLGAGEFNTTLSQISWLMLHHWGGLVCSATYKLIFSLWSVWLGKSTKHIQF